MPPIMSPSRRELLKELSVVGALGTLGGLPGLAPAAAAGRVIPWRNWSGGQVCLPEARLAPADEAQLVNLLQATTGPIRPVGSAHSFSALVPTSGTIVSLNNITGMIGSDPDKLQSEFYAGTRMSEMGEPLKEAGLALPNMSDIDYQTLAGAISTSTHGTGIKFGSYSTQVIGLRLVTAKGDVIDCDADHHPEIFNAARVSLGALGIITRVKLQNRKAFRLHSRQWIQSTEELNDDMDRLVRDNEHFELNAILHSDISLATATNETNDTRTIAKEGGGDGTNVGLLEMVDSHLRDHPRVQAAVLNFIAHRLDFPDVIDDSFRVFANVRDIRFNEMEYEVPVEAGPDCLRDVLKLVRDRNLHSYIPLEYRYVKGDDIWLSMFNGGDRCAISVHQYYDLDYHNFFAEVEPIFWRYEGRPHWGKLHNLNSNQLSRLYPHWKEFLDVRAELDPAGRLLNGHLRTLFGLT